MSWTIQTLVRELLGRGAKPALVVVQGDTVREVSSADLAEQATSLAWGLRDHGIQPGETVGLIAPNGPDWVVARLALACTGAVVVALDDLAAVAELRIALDEAQCRRILTSASHVAALRQIDPSCDLIVLDDSTVDGTTPWRRLFLPNCEPLPVYDSAKAAMLVYTSGTTGRPKAFELTSDHLWANVGALMKTGALQSGERVLQPLPLHHVYPFAIGILTVLCCGAAVVFPEEVAGPQIIKALSLAKVTAVIGVPRLYTALVSGLKAKIAASGSVAIANALLALSIWSQKRLGVNAGRLLMASVRKRLGPELRMAVSGGALLAPDVLWTLVGLGLTVRTGYGLAETASIFTGNLPGNERYESEGRPFCGQIRIVAENGSEEGEIQLRGPSVFAGYRNNEDANRDAFTSDGWFRTGDVGYLDRAGFLFVTGRIKETLVLGGGKKLHPDELEKHYASPFMKELAVLERDGVLVALVLPDLEAIRAAGHPRVDDVIRVALSEAALTLPSYERLAGFRIVREPLPKTRLGKFQRFRLKPIYDAAGTVRKTQAPLSEDDKALLAGEPAKSVFALLKKRYPDKPVHLDASPLLDLGIDSLEWVSLGLVLEQQLGVQLDEGQAGESLTIRDLLRQVCLKPANENADGAADIIDHWLRPSGPLFALLARVLLAFNTALMKGLFRLTVEGRENLPSQGSFIVVANHESDLDVAMMAAALGMDRMRQVYWAGDAVRLFSAGWRRAILRALNVFPANEKRASETLTVSAEVLRRGNGLVWFPESWRSPDGKLQHFLPGIGLVLKQAPVPVIPAFVEGAFEAMPRTARLPRLKPLTISFGKPMLLPPDLAPQEIADRLHDAVAELSGEVVFVAAD